MPVAGVAIHRERQLRRAGEMDPVERFGKSLQLCLPGRQARGTGAAKYFPVAEFRRVTDVTGQGEFCTREVRLKMIKLPGVVGLKPQGGLDVVKLQAVRRLQRPDQPALAQYQPFDLHLPV